MAYKAHPVDLGHHYTWQIIGIINVSDAYTTTYKIVFSKHIACHMAEIEVGSISRQVALIQILLDL